MLIYLHSLLSIFALSAKNIHIAYLCGLHAFLSRLHMQSSVCTVNKSTAVCFCKCYQGCMCRNACNPLVNHILQWFYKVMLMLYFKRQKKKVNFLPLCAGPVSSETCKSILVLAKNTLPTLRRVSPEWHCDPCSCPGGWLEWACPCFPDTAHHLQVISNHHLAI